MFQENFLESLSRKVVLELVRPSVSSLYALHVLLAFFFHGQKVFRKFFVKSFEQILPRPSSVRLTANLPTFSKTTFLVAPWKMPATLVANA